MAKNDKSNDGTENVTVADGAAPAPATDGAPAAGTVAENKGDQRFIRYNVPQKDGSSSLQNRADIIRGLWKGESDTPAVGSMNPNGEKWARGPIAKKLTELAGVKVIYQIVFAATKGVPGGPDKPAAAQATGTAPAEVPPGQPAQ